jgi:hypothetical protein
LTLIADKAMSEYAKKNYGRRYGFLKHNCANLSNDIGAEGGIGPFDTGSITTPGELFDSAANWALDTERGDIVNPKESLTNPIQPRTGP